jgi:hypothetical protein
MIARIPKSGTMLTGIVLVLPDNLDPNKIYQANVFAHGIGERGPGDAIALEDFLKNKAPDIVSLVAAAGQVLIAPQLLEGDWMDNYFDFVYGYISSNYHINLKVSADRNFLGRASFVDLGRKQG